MAGTRVPPEGVEVHVIDLRPQGLHFYGIPPSSWRALASHLERWQECAKARGKVIEEVNRYMRAGEFAGD